MKRRATTLAESSIRGELEASFVAIDKQSATSALQIRGCARPLQDKNKCQPQEAVMDAGHVASGTRSAMKAGQLVQPVPPDSFHVMDMKSRHGDTIHT